MYTHISLLLLRLTKHSVLKENDISVQKIMDPTKQTAKFSDRTKQTAKNSDPTKQSCGNHGSNKTKRKKHGSNKTTGKKCRIQQNSAGQLSDPTKQNAKMGSNKTKSWIARMHIIV